MRFLKFTHAQTNTAVYINDALVFAWYSNGKSNFVVANAGASIPVAEDLETIQTRIEGETNGTETKRPDGIV
jgi:hypothetical protein